MHLEWPLKKKTETTHGQKLSELLKFLLILFEDDVAGINDH